MKIENSLISLYLSCFLSVGSGTWFFIFFVPLAFQRFRFIEETTRLILITTSICLFFICIVGIKGMVDYHTFKTKDREK